MERLNLPRLATLALALLIGLQLAWIVTGALGSHVVAGFCEHFVLDALGPDLEDPLEGTLWSRRSCDDLVDQVHAPLSVVGWLRPGRNPNSLGFLELRGR